MPLRPCRRSYEVEENKRLVLDEVEDTGLTPGLTGLTRARGRRARRRNAWDRRVVAATPVFYGWVVAALAALSALIVSPAQVFCVGVVVDAIVKDTQPMTRLDVTRAYAVAGLISAPLITLYPAVLLRLPRRVFLLGCGIGVCVGLLLLSFATGALTLTLSWTLLQSLGPGMLYPCADSALHDWWRRRRQAVSVGVHAAAACLGMIALPALLFMIASCDGCRWEVDCDCWRGAYASLAALIVPLVAVLGALMLDGGAADHDLFLDDRPRETAADAAAAAAAAEGEAEGEAPASNAAGDSNGGGGGAVANAARRGLRRGRLQRGGWLGKPAWALSDVLHHSTYWLAQVSISVVQAIVAAILFHRSHLIHALLAPPLSNGTDSGTGGGGEEGGSGAALPSPGHSPYAVDTPGALTFQVVVGLLTMVCTPLPLLVPRQEYLPLAALALCALGTAQLLLASDLDAVMRAGALLGAAYGATHAYGSGALWSYFYGSDDAARIQHVSVAITTAAAGVGIYIFGWAWEHAGALAEADGGPSRAQRYHGPLLGATALAASLGVADAMALARPEMLELVVRRAPTWEQLLAFRQRAAYFSNARRARELWRAVRGAPRSEAHGAAGQTPARRSNGFVSSGAWDESSVREAHQAHPIEPKLKIVEDDGL